MLNHENHEKFQIDVILSYTLNYEKFRNNQGYVGIGMIVTHTTFTMHWFLLIQMHLPPLYTLACP